MSEPGDKARERGLAAAGRTPEKHRADVVAFDLQAQRLAGAKKFFLADEFVERARAHALGERLVRGGDVSVHGGGREFGEEAHRILESRAFEQISEFNCIDASEAGGAVLSLGSAF